MGRIVINFEPGKPPARRKLRRWPRIFAILAIFIVAIIALAATGGFLWWRHYQSTPAHSLALLIDAAQRNDTQELNKRLDNEELAKNMLADVRQKAIDRYDGAINTSTQQQIDKVISTALPHLKETINNEVLDEIKSVVPSLVKFAVEGDIAKASAPVSNRTIELTMQRDADGWKVIGFSDDAVVQRVVDSVMKDLPAIGAFDSSTPLFKNPGRPRKRQR